MLGLQQSCEVENQAIRSPGQTAIERLGLSRPVQGALNDGLLPRGTTFFDYGCGRGGDIRRLLALGVEADGWDPAHRPHTERRPADVVNLGYVVNVIERPSERGAALEAAWRLAQRVLVVAARLDWESDGVTGRPHADGMLTAKGTFQKFFRQEELRDWIESVLGVRPVAAAPGVFYLFRDESLGQSVIAARVRHRPVQPRRTQVGEAEVEAHRDLLNTLVAFVTTRGRAPEPFELPESAEIGTRFGSIRAAVALIQRITGDRDWRTARAAAIDDLTVYLALAAFGGRPRFGTLPVDLQVDVKAFYGSYREASAAADRLLFEAGNRQAVDQACRTARVGKLTPEALYVHRRALALLPPLLRVYEGCGRALTGTVEEATVIKLNRVEARVSYLAYPTFDSDPHPALASSVRADLRRLHVRYRDFRSSVNPPILHRKETLVGDDDPNRVRFARLTAQEERARLLDDARGIGTRERWSAVLIEKGYRLSGHRLLRIRRPVVRLGEEEGHDARRS